MKIAKPNLFRILNDYLGYSVECFNMPNKEQLRTITNTKCNEMIKNNAMHLFLLEQTVNIIKSESTNLLRITNPDHPFYCYIVQVEKTHSLKRLILKYQNNMNTTNKNVIYGVYLYLRTLISFEENMNELL